MCCATRALRPDSTYGQTQHDGWIDGCEASFAVPWVALPKHRARDYGCYDGRQVCSLRILSIQASALEADSSNSQGPPRIRQGGSQVYSAGWEELWLNSRLTFFETLLQEARWPYGRV